MPAPPSTPVSHQSPLPPHETVISTGAAKPRSGETHFLAQAEHSAGIERRRQLRGLMLLAFAVMAFALWRAGLDRVFTPGWWRLW
ncbi:MAG: hypothetical protein JST61_00925 [Acidobacteria bacterium]|nr:hypothetical protein [Acidobacteriota bacterium]